MKEIKVAECKENQKGSTKKRERKKWTGAGETSGQLQKWNEETKWKRKKKVKPTRKLYSEEEVKERSREKGPTEESK